jgi:hypothetical protein
MSSVQKQRLSPEEYLAIERKAECKSEYFDGEMFRHVRCIAQAQSDWMEHRR